MKYEVRTQDDLYGLKQKTNLDAVTVDLSRIKYKGLSHHAIRLAFFAVREGGEIILNDTSASMEQSIGPFLIGWPSLRALGKMALARDCQLLPEKTLGQMRFVRTTPLPARGWSAGIIFSGQDREIAALILCLDGLCNQPELLGQDGEILVCGPTRDLDFLKEYPMVRYVEFDLTDPKKPFPISIKKNFLMQKMRFPRRLVLHTRIVMQSGALARAPLDFDILAPNVIKKTEKGEEANLGFICIDPSWPRMTPKSFERSTLNVVPGHYLKLLAHGRPYVDGGAFAVHERVLENCPLNNDLLWGDCEDVEWCFRAQSLGFIVDLAPQFIATNMVSKVKTLEFLPRPLAHGLRSINRLKRFGRSLLERLRG